MRVHGLIIIIILVALLSTVALQGCSAKKQQETLPPPPPTAEQRKERNAEELRSVAARVADQAVMAMGEREDVRGIPVFVRPPMDTRFEQTFYEFLVSELVSRGVKVSVQQEYGLVMDYRLVDSVVVTASLRYNNVYVMQSSDIEYMGDAGVGSSARDAVWNRYAKRRPIYSP